MTRSVPHRRLLFLLGLAAVALLLVGGWLLWSRGRPPAPAQPSAADAAKIQALLGRLATDDSDAAVDALVALGDPAVPALVSALNDPDDDRRARIVDVLSHIRSPAAVAPLLALLGHASSDVTIDAVVALGAIGDRQAVLPLQDLYKTSDSPQVRYEALTSLGLLGDPRSVPLLLEATGASDQYARLWSIDALCVMDAPPAREAGLRLLDDPSRYVRRRVLRACATILATPRVDDAVIAHALKDPDFETTVWARRVIASQLADATAHDELAARMRAAAEPLLPAGAPSTPEQYQAVFLLAELRDGSMIDQLTAALHSPNVLLRQHAAFLLGQDGSPRALPGLVAALEDPQDLVRQTARAALQSMAARGQPTAAAALAEPGS